MKILVAGCGLAVREGFRQPDGITVLGINDCEQYGIRPDHLLVIDAPTRFDHIRRRVIERTKAKVFWHCTSEWDQATKIAAERQKLKIKAWREWREQGLADPDLPGFMTSMIPAIVLAHRLGGRDIAVTGCDITGHAHLEDKTLQVNQFTRALLHLLKREGTTVVNASGFKGRLTAHLRAGLESWAASPATLQ